MPSPSSTLPPRIATLNHGVLPEGDTDVLRAHYSFDAMRFTAADLEGRDLTGITLESCVFDGLQANETMLRAATLTDTAIARLNAPVLIAARLSLRDVTIDGSRIGSAELYESNFSSVSVAGSKLGFVNLRTSILADVLFTACTIDELDVSGSKITRMAFGGTTIGTLDLTNSTLTHVDLRGAEISRIVGLPGLKGATVSHDQLAELAPLFADHFGLVVEG
ncbi:pentapeptide repeat-containing protein [Glaciihabitans arcticus]|uniref:Pentapeptide repeat-containing protein n=1 Tax=Glaciihabitans arcticus TaxID=2668039 RepID=A0A4Q9GSQ9_9MICO|nr:pentapeptide repeat-containing protein [Glaciihabitans arcticus]TBN57635.1 pentapeptide repeat-containing protein [Glaciihabitans arcticus]